MSDNLKPCPFCGGDAEHYHRPDDSGWENTDWVGCTDGCGASTACYETKELAVMVWNTRIEPEGVTDRIEELEAKLAKAMAEMEKVDEYLTRLQTPNSEPLNSVNVCQNNIDRAKYTAEVRNEAREHWASLGNTIAELKGEKDE